MSSPYPAIGLRSLILYGLPGLPLAAVTLPLYIHIPNFYAVDLGLGLAAVGLVVLAMRLWDVVTDPLVGMLSDRIGTRFGRRKLWVAIGLPVAVAGGWMMFRPPVDAGLAYLLIAGLILHLGWTLVMLPYQAWGAELSSDYAQRNRIAAWREGFVVLGTLVAGGLVAAAGSPETRTDALATVGLVMAVGLPLAVAPALLFLADPPIAVRVPPPAWREDLRRMVRNKPFVRLLAAWILNGIANGLPATLFLLYVGVILGQPEKSGTFLATYFLMAIAGLPLWLWIAVRIGKHRAWCIAMIWACAWFALAPFLGPGDDTLYLALCVGTGLALAADLALPPSMQADAVDVDTAQGGPAKTGIYFALWGMATKLALALAVGIAFPVLEAAGLDTEGTAGPAGPNEGALVLALLYGAVPIAFKAAAIALMWRFPLNAEEQGGLRARIEGSVG
ncbi:MFS transporter [Pacificispira sp.]|uniref:MFS transporter n=1 Tax=Pacificispira sp. TaxID=2888761 RepID=UPI003B52AEEA